MNSMRKLNQSSLLNRQETQHIERMTSGIFDMDRLLH
jgi:hypothetical protein